ncbi:hypothetical protein OZ410_14065 [Robiginitalea sp. M366]|uniref:TolB family protein n=1 Tax=Robiginitalea aestuariiviva TaxID=3036903 RepID=UPI00240DEEE5|nr:hypothetical protein [Robiginitalea aestuariiviva]MDG1573451.1 hypothetical protein [Robiginitalea aestuariiviva]
MLTMLFHRTLQHAILLATLTLPAALLAQPDTEVYQVRLENGRIAGPAQNLSDNPGYDNQPAYLPDGSLLYARTRNGQTDIAHYSAADGTTQWVCDTPGGGEYSPTPIPGSDAVSAIRLDTTGLQRLYRYTDGEPTLLLNDLKVGYHLWAGPDLLICTVLREDRMDLVMAHPGTQGSRTLRKGVGRSLARIPGSHRISFTSPEDEQTWVFTLDPETGEQQRLLALPAGVQDLAWLPDGSLLCGGPDVLRQIMPGTEAQWRTFHRFEAGVGHISRLSVSPDSQRLAFVAEKTVAHD